MPHKASDSSRILSGLCDLIGLRMTSDKEAKRAAVSCIITFSLSLLSASDVKETVSLLTESNRDVCEDFKSHGLSNSFGAIYVGLNSILGVS